MNGTFLRVTEIFYSIQGESATVGIPTSFIRLTGCPLRCHYCDTQYAFSGGENLSIEDILARVRKFPTNYITLTGGEPLAQKNAYTLLDKLIGKAFFVSLETSGAIDLAGVNPKVVKVMDLKTPSSGEQVRNLYTNFDYLDKKDQIKFVIGSQEDYLWARDTLKKFHLDERCSVLFSPVTGQMDATRLADSILADGLPVRFQIQLHKILWGNTPGK
ncbi:MAG: 7-carboxy-7-deazaguanine synthase QueE [Methylococcales bacterium]